MAMNGSNKVASEKQKMVQEKCLAILTNMLKDEDNKYCVDCDAKGPRWASWNLGVFLCIRCAGIHRNLGVHISKVKSVNLDTWKPEQAVALQQMGNSRARAVYEANLPDNFRRPQTDSALEAFIRAKYEHNKYTAREWVPPPLPKVNWDAEIDAAIKEHRNARKAGRGRVEGPAPVLNKPVSVPPAAPRPAADPAERPTPAPAPASSAAADLLGLDSPAPAPAAAPADPFGDFLAAAPVSDRTEPVAAGDAQLDSEEASFFGQPAAAVTSVGGVLSRDSILALYGQPGGSTGGSGGLVGFPSVPAGGYAPAPVASSMAAGYGSVPVTGAPAGPGYPPGAPGYPPGAPGYPPVTGAPAGPGYPLGGYAYGLVPAGGAPLQRTTPFQLLAGPYAPQPVSGAPQPANSPLQLQQQVAGLSLGRPAMGPGGQPWQ
ncbi:stromal membrane-associated protein 1-like isoform X3 [Amphibalanus amphitrite]|uniref:stromal membrane-associated protein 1-like isoform X3 n=1 Tax=Amphibalanus amphitrite TaxID=1232801 RepID=UPI001C915779|nr:stromal membrane-associated protein 1-like isoform X3 [Amphibalanus amphitrite]